VNTAHDNTILMIFAMAYAFVQLVGPDFNSFLDDFSPICFGDDCTFTVADSIIDRFNGKTISLLLYDELNFVFESPDWDARPFHQLGFLSMHFHWNPKHRSWVHKINRDRLLSNILQGGSTRTPAEQMQRMCNMRNVAFGDEQLTIELEKTIREYRHIFSSMDGDADWDQACQSYVTDIELQALYFGYESYRAESLLVARDHLRDVPRINSYDLRVEKTNTKVTQSRTSNRSLSLYHSRSWETTCKINYRKMGKRNTRQKGLSPGAKAHKAKAQRAQFKRAGPKAAKTSARKKAVIREEVKIANARIKSGIQASGSFVGATRALLPKMLKMKTNAGLNMRGGTISGVTEITPDLQLTSALNVAGTVLYSTALHPLLLAPGSRFADIAAMYDQYCFESLSITLASDLPYTINGMIGGGLERDPGDPIAAAGGTIDVTKYMEHSNFHAESVSNKRGVRFPKDPKAVAKAGRGSTSGMFFNRLPAAANDLTTLFQGQLVIFIHSALSTDTNSALNYPFSLGPLTLRWRIRMKEAAEKNTMVGNADYHSQSSSPSTANPLNWSASFVKQPTLQSWSTLILPTMCTSSQIWAQLPVGYYYASLTTSYTSTGAGDYAWQPYLTAATGLNLIAASPTSPTTYSTKLSSTASYYTSWIHFQVTGPGTNAIPGAFELFTAFGTATGWVAASAQLHLVAMPVGESTYLAHKDPTIRSLAWARLRDGADRKQQAKRDVEEALKEYGIERKERKGECKYTKQIEERHSELLKAPELKRQTRSRLDELEDFVVERERKERKRPFTPEDDLDQEWDEKEFLNKRYTFTGQKLRIMQDDEKSDRTKPADKRASSLKS